LITLPLWLWATRATESYTLAVTVFIGIVLVAYVSLKIWRNVQDREIRLRERVLRILKRLSVSILFVVLLYGILLLFASRLYVIAIPALVVYLLLLGFVRYAKKRSFPSS
jgi:putative flippase GtrA